MPKQKPTVSLATFTLELKDSDNPKTPVVLNKIRGQKEGDAEKDFLAELDKILKPLNGVTKLITPTGQAAGITNYSLKDRYIRGVVSTGSNGKQQHIVDTNTGKETYVTKTNEAILQPLYFLFYIPEGENKAVVILERYSHSALQGLLLPYLEYQFKGANPSHRFDLQYLTDTETFNQMLEEARVKEIRLTENQWSKERSDNTGKARKIEGKLSITLKPYRDSGYEWINKIKKVKADGLEIGNILEMEVPLEPDEASFVIARKGAKDRRINFEDTRAIFRPYFDISDKVKTGSNGHPTFASLDKAATDVLADVTKGLYEPNRKG